MEVRVKKIPRTCKNCNAFHIIERERWNPDTHDFTTYRVGQCWGVSEPFEVRPEDRDKPCTAYPGAMQEERDIVHFEGLEEALMRLGYYSTDEVVNDLTMVKKGYIKEAPYGDEE